MHNFFHSTDQSRPGAYVKDNRDNEKFFFIDCPLTWSHYMVNKNLLHVPLRFLELFTTQSNPLQHCARVSPKHT